MNVLHININYIGTELHQNLINSLNEMNVNSIVFAPTYNPQLSVIKPANNVIVCKCFRKWDRISFFYKQHKILSALEDKVITSKVQIIHAYTLFSDGNVAFELNKKYGIPYVVAIRDTDVNDFFKLRFYLRKRGVEIMENADRVFFLSPAYQKTVFEKYVPEFQKELLLKKCEVIPNGIDNFWFQNVCLTNKKIGAPIKILYVGQICRRKNIEMTIKAIRLLQKRGYQIQFTVIGKCVDKKICKRIQAEENVTVLPSQCKKQLVKYYDESSLFVMPSITETFGLVYAEALSQGLPIVYTKQQGFDGQFKEGFVGYRVVSGDAEDIANGIEKVINNFEKLQRNCVYAAEKFQWCKIAEKYVSIYKDIIKERSPL